MLYTRVIYEALRTPWALMPEMLAVVADVLRFRAMGGRLTADEIRARIRSARIAAGRAARSASCRSMVSLHTAHSRPRAGCHRPR